MFASLISQWRRWGACEALRNALNPPSLGWRLRRCWAQYFANERQYGEWEELHRRLLAERAGPPAPEEQALLLARTIEALTAILAFLQAGELDSALAAQEAVEGHFEAALLVVPEEGSSRSGPRGR